LPLTFIPKPIYLKSGADLENYFFFEISRLMKGKVGPPPPFSLRIHLMVSPFEHL
jgi:hypothetical protein